LKKHDGTTKAIYNKGFSANSNILPRSNFGADGQERACNPILHIVSAVKHHFILILILALASQHLKAATQTTVASGSQNSPSVLSTAAVPPYSSAGTFIIRHHIVFENDLVMNHNSEHKPEII